MFQDNDNCLHIEEDDACHTCVHMENGCPFIHAITGSFAELVQSFPVEYCMFYEGRNRHLKVVK